MDQYSYIKHKYKNTPTYFNNNLKNAFSKIKEEKSIKNWLWLFFLCIITPIAYIMLPFLYLFDITSDKEFSREYLEYQIEKGNLSNEKIIVFLNEQLLIYKEKKLENRLHYSDYKHNKVIETFDFLFSKYKLNDTIQPILIDIKQSVDSVSTYTQRKEIEELEEKEKLETLQSQQEQRKTTAHNRAKGRMLTSFECDISDTQLHILLECCNQIPIFTRDIEKDELKNILLCTHTAPLQVESNRHIATLFSKLSYEKLICKTWMAVAENQKCFLSKNDKLLTSKDLSTANSNSFAIRKDTEKLIDKCIYNILQK